MWKHGTVRTQGFGSQSFTKTGSTGARLVNSKESRAFSIPRLEAKAAKAAKAPTPPRKSLLDPPLEHHNPQHRAAKREVRIHTGPLELRKALEPRDTTEWAGALIAWGELFPFGPLLYQISWSVICPKLSTFFLMR